MPTRICPNCGAELQADILDGLCPKCVLGKVMEEPEEKAEGRGRKSEDKEPGPAAGAGVSDQPPPIG